ncbi:MAG: FtsX-like permease family protein [Burkholderiales bacterium]
MEIRPILSVLMRSKTAPLLVAIQIALCLAILANALYVVNLRQASSARPSGLADEAGTFTITAQSVKRPTHREALAQQRRDVETLKAIPGVKAVTWISQMPMSRSGSNSSFSLDRKQARYSIILSIYYAPPGAIDVLGLKLLEGRDIAHEDMVEFDAEKDLPTKTWPRAIVITKAAADKLYPGESAVGKTLYFGTGDDAMEMRVVGVVERLQTTLAEEGPNAEYSAILPVAMDLAYPRFAVGTEPGQRDRVIKDAEAALRDPANPRMVNTRTSDGDRNNRYRAERSLAWMLMGVCALLLLVTASGIVGMTMLRIAQRRKQIGVRRALGARRIDIVRYFVVENVLVSTAGIAAGLVLAVALNQLLVGALELPRLPATYLAIGAAALWALGVAAVMGPAWRAASIPPAEATRSV